MKTLRFDSIGGASGNMILAALIDLGTDLEEIKSILKTLHIGDFNIHVSPSSDHNLNGKLLEVIPEKDAKVVHRHLSDICDLITASNMPDNAKKNSILIFKKLADAEASIHGTTPEKIHFHEVGAVDSIVDITGACIAIALLEIDSIQISPLPLGSGSTVCEHGTIPIPAPATVELLKGHPILQTSETSELVTPTGAAILTTWASIYPAPPVGNISSIAKTGSGLGSRKLKDRPNLLRAILLEDIQTNTQSDDCMVLESNIDDTVPELLGALTQKLIENGALDVFTTAVQMKKQRPGTLLTVICRAEDKDRFIDIIFTESTTFGIREHFTKRTILERRTESMETPYGTIRIKIGSWQGKDITRAPEHDDCVRCAKQHNVSVRKVYEAALCATVQQTQ